MAVRKELNASDVVSPITRYGRRNVERFTRRGTESRIFSPSYRSRNYIIPCRPRRPLASYMDRLYLQSGLCYRKSLSEIRAPLEIYTEPVSKYESSITQTAFKEKFFKKSSLIESSRKNCQLCQIEQVKKGFSCLPSSFLFSAITGVIISGYIIIVGIFYIFFLCIRRR